MNDKTRPAPARLALVGAAIIPATESRLIVKDHFQRNPEVKISAVGEKFQQRFYGLIEEPAAQITLRACKLLKNSHKAPTIARIGAAAGIKSTVAALLTLLKRQAGGERGILQTNGYANVFFAQDRNGELCAIRAGWNGQGWDVDAISADDPPAWDSNHRVFCPKPAKKRS